LCDKVTSAGLRHLSGLQQLQTLRLDNCKQITDAGLLHLSSLQKLQTLHLGNTAVTKAAEAAFWAQRKK
jgi:F-box/leucine-rich repeat protein 14